MNVLDLFSGIGGFSLGLERAGMRTVAFCEIDPFCRQVLKKHWPQVRCYDDISRLTANTLATDGIAADVLCGGFPCQDISVAGKGAGIQAARSGLWSEYARLIDEVRPRYVIVENVSVLRSRGLGRVLGDLAALGYDAEWHCIPACAVGAPHRRDRVWIVAYPKSIRCREGRQGRSDSGCAGQFKQSFPAVADSIGPRLEGCSILAEYIADELAAPERGGQVLADTACKHVDRSRPTGSGRWTEPADGGWWLSEPDVGRVAHGVPARVDRLRSLGNAVVPQITEIIGRAIMSLEANL